jgi:hypothetical protein
MAIPSIHIDTISMTIPEKFGIAIRDCRRDHFPPIPSYE